MDHAPVARYASSGTSERRHPDGSGNALAGLPAELRPHPNLMRYYVLTALMFGPGFLIAIFPFFFRYRTLRYDVDDEGITMRWGILFRREISLTYARIQDIQLTSNVVERWLGLARIQLQTASGSANAEMTIEGVREVGAMRDFLYARMRGARDRAGGARGGQRAPENEGAATRDDAELAATLDAVADELRALRLALIRAGRTPGDA
jgi:membrane protein YdbS with pleckstrin-like domain